jgi:predicted phage tail protein
MRARGRLARAGIAVRGAGGGGKGGGGGQTARAPVEAPNDLRSIATARVVDIVSEGEIEGFGTEIPGQSVAFEDTLLQNADESFNFSNVQLAALAGLPDQSPLPGFAAAESEVVVGVEVTKDNPLGSGSGDGAVVRQIADANVDAVRVTLRFPALTSQNTTTGDLNGTSVAIRIDVQADGGSYETYVSDTVQGKTTSAYERSYRVDLPAGGAPWNVKVARVTADNLSANIQNKTFWSSYTEIVDHRLIYPDSALIGLAVDAQSFGGRVPRRRYYIKGIKLKVPSNYDPETREYDGIWDGTFQIAWSDNPAWVLYDLLTNPRYGLGESIDASQVDKWGLFEIAQYCDALVPDGFGGTEPRFTFNYWISSREEAYKVIQGIASAFRGLTYWATGSVFAAADMPADPMFLVAPANVVGGLFNYSGAGLKARHTVALVTWYDPADGCRPAVEVVEDPEGIDRFGWRQAEVAAYGCTSRGQAIRFGRWILDSERHETETVSYTASLDHLFGAEGRPVMPGMIVHIADPAYAGVRYGGRVASATVDAVTLDKSVDLQAGETYSLSVVLPDATIETIAVTNGPGESAVMALDSPLSQAPAANALWVLTGTDAAPRPFRVLAVRETDKHLFEVTALFHDATKYDRVEQNLTIDPPSFTALPAGPILPPSGLSIAEYLYLVQASIKSAVTLSWEPSPDPRVMLYEIQAAPPGEEYRAVDIRGLNSVDIQDTRVGTWRFRVRSLASGGQPSAWRALEDNVLGLGAAPPDVENFRISVVGALATLTWSPSADLALSHYRIKFAPVTTGATWGSAVDLQPHVDATSVQVPALDGTYLIKAVRLPSETAPAGAESMNATLIVTTIAGVEGLNAVETVSEHDDSPAWAGAKTHCEEAGGTLVMSLTGDSPEAVEIEGLYEFANSVDLGAVYTSRLTAHVKAFGSNIANVMASWNPLAGVPTLGGGDPEQWSVTLQLRFTVDDPLGSPVDWSDWQDFVVGDYTARAFEFRLILESFDPAIQPVVQELSVTVDMDDRVDAREDIVVPDTGLRVTFVPPFHTLKGIGYGDQDMASGDKRIITNKDETGFDIQYQDSMGAGVQRTLDYVAKGYGYEQ